MPNRKDRRSRFVTATVALGVTGFVAASCSSSVKSTATSATSPASTSATTPSAASAPGHKKTIAYDIYSEGVVFDVAEVQGVQEQAKEMGYNVIIDNANGDATTQANQIRTLISDHVDGVIITPVDSAAIVPSILALNQANIPVVDISVAPKAGKVWTTITADTYKIGYNQGVATVNLLKQRYGTPKGNVVFGEGTPTVDVAVNELNGFKAALQPYPDIHLVATFAGNYVESDSYNAMLTVLAAHPQGSGANAIDVAVGADDNIAAGITQAILHLGRDEPVGSPKRILIIGADGSPDGVKNLENGQWSVDIGLDPVTGAKAAVKELALAMAGQPTPGPFYYTPQPVLTPDNVKASGIWGLTYK